MFLQALAGVAAKLPSNVKLKLHRLRPLYSKIVSFRQPAMTAKTCAGSVNWQPDALTSQQFLFGTYEPQLQSALKQFVRPGAVVYDVGAHAGYISLTAARLAGSNGHVFSFEPRKSNRESIERQLAVNPDLRVTLLPYALSNRDGDASFDPTTSSSQGRISDSGTVRVEVRSIDRLVADGTLQPPNVIKIDVEGHEEQVMEGAARTIASSTPVIICDYNAGDTAAAMRRVLQPLGYEITAKEAVITAVPSHFLPINPIIPMGG